MNDLLTIGECATLAAVSIKTIRRAYACGELAIVKINPRVIRVRRGDFASWYNSKRVDLSTTGYK